MFRVLRAVSGSNWVSWCALIGAVCKVAPLEVLDYCLKELGGKSAADGMIVRSPCNPCSGAFEYRLEPGNPSSNSTAATIGSSVVTCPSEDNLIQDLKFLYETCYFLKQFMKGYNKCETRASMSNPTTICLSCEAEIVD